MKEFEIEVTIQGYYYFEPSSCPWEWRGSGIYDDEGYETVQAVCYVLAQSEESAKNLINAYSFSEYNGHIDNITIDNVSVFDEDPEEGEIETVLDVVLS